jgi:hypothetical protein
VNVILILTRKRLTRISSQNLFNFYKNKPSSILKSVFGTVLTKDDLLGHLHFYQNSSTLQEMQIQSQFFFREHDRGQQRIVIDKL